MQDSSGNYVNHGRWTMYDEQGHTISYGDYRYGERHGVWTRWHTPTGKDMFSQLPFKSFQAPFVSEVMFDNGRMHGIWTIYDSKDRKCSEFTFEHDEREGKSSWFYPNGEKMREIDFTAGQLDGHWMEWGPTKNVTKNESYQNGRGLAKKAEMHKGSKVKKSEGTYLLARQVLKTTYDWWNAAITTTTSVEGKDQRHGAFASWHPNGQKNEEGHYLNDLPVGNSPGGMPTASFRAKASSTAAIAKACGPGGTKTARRRSRASLPRCRDRQMDLVEGRRQGRQIARGSPRVSRKQSSSRSRRWSSPRLSPSRRRSHRLARPQSGRRGKPRRPRRPLRR